MEKSKSSRFPIIGVALLIVFLATSVFLIMSLKSPPRLSRSAMGFDGLVALLDANGVDSRSFYGGGTLNADGIGLRILPLFDDDLYLTASTPSGEESQYLRPEIQRIFRDVISTKIETLPTLVVMAKWRDGIRLAGFIHPDFLLPAENAIPTEPVSAEESGNAYSPTVDSTADDDWDVEGFAGDGDIVELVSSEESEAEPEPSKPPIETLANDAFDDYQQAEFGAFYRQVDHTPGDLELISLAPRLSGEATIYAPQRAVGPPNCEVLVGDGDGGLLFECLSNGISYWLLSDPDLLNNHGLARGENQRLALELIRGLTVDGVVLVDYSTRPWLLPDMEEHARSLSDLLRYFEPPFRWLWLAGLGFLIILLWRGGVRGTPLLRRFSEGHGAERKASLATQAQLMRRARADGALLKTLLATHIATLAERMLGRDGSQSDREGRVMRGLKHRDVAAATAFRDAIAEIRNLPDTAGLDQTVPALSRLETAYKKALTLT